jgi:hypothetical protein
MRIRFSVRELTVLLGLLNAVLSIGQDVGTLVLEKEIALPGVEGRIDHFSVDVPGERLFIAALENGSVEVVDTRQGERTAEVKGLEEPQRQQKAVRRLQIPRPAGRSGYNFGANRHQFAHGWRH